MQLFVTKTQSQLRDWTRIKHLQAVRGYSEWPKIFSAEVPHSLRRNFSIVLYTDKKKYMQHTEKFNIELLYYIKESVVPLYIKQSSNTTFSMYLIPIDIYGY